MRIFTVEDANRTLPLVRRIVADIVVQHERWADCLRASEVLAANATPGHPDPRAEAAERELNALAREIEGYRQELTALGIELKDYARGLVDFPAELEGRPVWLCWRLGEPAVEHWHELEAGYAGRQRIASLATV